MIMKKFKLDWSERVESAKEISQALVEALYKIFPPKDRLIT